MREELLAELREVMRSTPPEWMTLTEVSSMLGILYKAQRRRGDGDGPRLRIVR
ncbi:hypothetical protein [Gordonia sp. (in: high G+C Gram-positive bacteria)]|uniref:hypothetical protein n=1 Tax=Gordonia sp. (in: high G+C Gram-positive bacteria) TaxID=84139 RepID=UPI0033424D94